MAESHVVSVQTLLEAGAHFGHITRRWNPKMSKFIYGEKNGIHQIDLRKTQLLIDYARDVMYEIAAKGQEILFVGTKSNAKETIEEQAKRAEIHYVSERWLGGMLTNFLTIRKSINRLFSIDNMEIDGTFDNITKKERLLLTRERERLRKVFGGIETMKSIPGVIFIVDAKKEHLAVKEARVLGIPIIGIVDTNTDPDNVDYPIPANDESKETAEIITTIMADAVIEGKANAKIRAKELGYDPNKKEQIYERETSDRSRFDRDRRGSRDGDRGRRGGRDDDRGRRGGRDDDRGRRGMDAEGSSSSRGERSTERTTSTRGERSTERTTSTRGERSSTKISDENADKTTNVAVDNATDKTTNKDSRVIRSRKKIENTTDTTIADTDSNSDNAAEKLTESNS